MLEHVGFLLRKWSSNDLSVLEGIPKELKKIIQSRWKSKRIAELKFWELIGINMKTTFSFPCLILERNQTTQRDILSI